MKLGAVRFVISTALIVGSLAVTPANAVSAADVRPIPAPRIFGGTEVSGSKAPWIVKIVTVDSKKPVVAGKKYGYYSCSGTVIAPNWILTAAHCVFDTDSDPVIRYPQTSVRAFPPGVAGSMSNYFSKGRAVSKIYIHPLYQKANGSFNADIALLRLAAPMPNSKSMALDDGRADIAVGSELKAYGWGVTDRAGEIDAKGINAAPLIVNGTASDPNCGYWEIQYGSWAPSFLCTTGGADSAVCSGDSGGPFVKYSATGAPVLVGITSYGSSADYCGTSDAPTIATRIAPMRWWIDAVIKRENSLVVPTAAGAWAFVSNSFAFTNGDIEQRNTGNIFALGWPEPDDSIINVERISGASGSRLNVSTRSKAGIVWWQDEENTNWINDAAMLRDGRVAWGESYSGYYADFPTLNVTAVSKTAVYRDWAGPPLAEKVLGADWENGWNWIAPRLTPLASGGIVASWLLYNSSSAVEDTVVAVFRSDGSLDTAFGSGGWARFDYSGGPSGLDLIVQTGEREFVLAGQIDAECAAIKILPSGLADASFGDGGVRRFRSPGTKDSGSTCRISEIVSDGTGGIYAVGSDNYLEVSTGAVAYATHITSSGAIDVAFGTEGWWTLNTTANDEFIGICKSTSGKLVIGGVASASSLRGYGNDRIGAMAVLTILTTSGKLAPQLGGRPYIEFNLGGERDRIVAVNCLSKGGAVLVGRTTVAADSVDDAEMHSIYIKINVK